MSQPKAASSFEAGDRKGEPPIRAAVVGDALKHTLDVPAVRSSSPELLCATLGRDCRPQPGLQAATGARTRMPPRPSALRTRSAAAQHRLGTVAAPGRDAASFARGRTLAEACRSHPGPPCHGSATHLSGRSQPARLRAQTPPHGAAGTNTSTRRRRAPCACRCRCCWRRCRGRSGWTWRAGLPRGRPPPGRPRPGAPRRPRTACARARSCGGRCGRRSGAPAEHISCVSCLVAATSCIQTMQRCMRMCRAKAGSPTAWLMLAHMRHNGVRGHREARQQGEREVSACARDASQGGQGGAAQARTPMHTLVAPERADEQPSQFVKAHVSLSASRPVTHEARAADHTCAAAWEHASPTAGCGAGCRPHPCAAGEVA